MDVDIQLYMELNNNIVPKDIKLVFRTAGTGLKFISIHTSWPHITAITIHNYIINCL